MGWNEGLLLELQKSGTQSDTGINVLLDVTFFNSPAEGVSCSSKMFNTVAEFLPMHFFFLEARRF